MKFNTLLELQKEYRRGKLQESELSDYQIDALTRLYDVQIRGLRASLYSKTIEIKHYYEELIKADKATEEQKAKFEKLDDDIQKIRLSNYKLLCNKNGMGLDLLHEDSYLSTYLSYEDLIWDLSFYYFVVDFDELISSFINSGAKVDKPRKYRGVCTIFENTDAWTSAYVHYADSLQQLLQQFEKHEQKSLENPDQVTFSPLGTEIYIYDENAKKYLLWLGGHEIRTVADILKTAHTEKKLIPSEAVQELASLDRVDVFISHKSQDFAFASKLYHYLLSCGIPTFLSELSLPTLSDSDYSFEIDTALEKAKNIVVIASSKENVLSGWVKYEWTSFANEKRSGRKDGSIVTLISDDMDVCDLPLLLRQYEVLSWNNYKDTKSFLLLDN